MKEEWKSIYGFPCYEVSSAGQVRSISRTIHRRQYGSYFKAGRIMKQQDNGNGYLFVPLCKDGAVHQKYIHTLVLEHFGPPKPSPRHECNHKDGDKSVNDIGNLEWVTSSENNIHAYSTGLRKKPNLHGEKNPRAKLSSKDILMIRHLYNGGMSRAEISRRFEISWTQSADIVSGKSWICISEGL